MAKKFSDYDVILAIILLETNIIEDIMKYS